MKILESSISEIDNKISLMYSESQLSQLEYRLHSVLVHEGSMESGHYWAYVFDHNAEVWLKFNDNTVTEATWQELQKESVGGHYNTSAYSLIYVQSSKLAELAGRGNTANTDHMRVLDLLSATGGYSMNFGTEDTELSFLTPDLVDYVRLDNQEFEEERRKWDDEVKRRRLESAQADECSDIQVRRLKRLARIQS